ncbi:MAG: hypothetical protein ACI9WC_000180 [Arenicella sp.]|jgi:hypothetical protein
MCTMTWVVKDGGYELFFNRDERVSRSRAELPSIQQVDDVQYLSPTDADAGGTWIAANQFGITVCLLNHYEFEQIVTYKQWTSRGEIVRSFATTKNLAVLEQQFLQLDLEDYRAFRMFVIDRDGNNRLCVWDGQRARIEDDVATPKSSSSVDAKHVKSLRKQLFSVLNLHDSNDSSQFINYHSSHVPSKSMDSVCMHREDANTVSFSHVKVSSESVEFAYADGAPCKAPLGKPLRIPLLYKPEVNPMRSPMVMAVKI